MGDAPHRLSAAAAAARIRAGDLTSAELVASCLDRIADREPDVHAWAHLDPDAALAAARARDAEEPGGPLHGVPVGVKDLIDTAEAPTTYGSPIYDGHRPDADAVCVTRLREAGAVILGKTVTTEFALFHPGPTANPRDLSRTPGGSSSGSAAAVADDMVPLALGTQTAGSIVRPASFCGIHGFKPTFGTVPTTGVKPVGPSLDTIGPLARDVDDLALCAGVVAGDPARFRFDPDGTPRLAFARTHEWPDAEPAAQQALLDLATGLGLPEITLPDEFARLVGAQQTIMAAEAATSLARERDSHPDLLSRPLTDLLDRGAAVTTSALQSAHGVAVRCRQLLSTVFADVDALLVPSVTGEAPKGLDATGDPLFCRAWTLLGVPCVAVPGLIGSAGAPLGVQVVAARDGDAAALAAAAWLGRRIEREAP